jgi:para-nitrobenzyl esterase
MNEPLARTRQGTVRGTVQQGVARFMGVPYAAPPVGALRFREPRPAQNWSGTRDAALPGANSPQIIRAFPSLDIVPLVGGGWQPGDTFLTANVWTPDPGARGLPVLVFIHGGAFVGGSSDAIVHAGTEFARSGLVCLAINYRLGIEGFLPIPGAVTNAGLRDQIAALHWVRDNIAAFGGDPDNVTVAGESAGAISLACLLASPAAAGLFRRAIVQSGHGSMVRTQAVARRVADTAARQLGISPDIDGFRSRSLAQCAGAVEAVTRPDVVIDMRDEEGRDPAYGLSRFLPVFDDDIIPEHPLEALKKGAGREVELLIGTTREEMNLYLVPTGVKQAISASAATTMLGNSIPRAAQILHAYGMERGPRAGAVLCDAMTDLVFRLPARRFAAAHQGRTHLYEFDWRSPACNGELGACHGLELPFVFKTLQTCTGAQGVVGTEPPHELAQRIHKIWANAVTHGELNWPQFDAESRQCMQLAAGTASEEPEMIAAAFV